MSLGPACGPDTGELEDGLARVFDDWYDRAMVRQGPRRAIAAELDRDRIFFPDRLIPYLDHPLVRDLPAEARRALSARHLYQYLEFTAHFEARVVNRAAERIANGRIGMPLKPRTRLDAFKIHCDESYHALFSLDLVQQIEAASGVAALPYRFENVLDRLDAVGPALLPDEPVLAQLLQLVVFETMVTSILSDVPRDTRVLTVVRDVVRDHARDEARHHAYFADFFKLLWLWLDRRQRERVARALPQLIRLSLWPDTVPVQWALAAAGLSGGQIARVLGDAYPETRVMAEIRHIARHCVQLFASVGVLDVPGGRDAFVAAGLLS